MQETKEKVFNASLKNELEVVEYNEQRILTTAQIAEAYGTDEKIISNNFNRNKERYIQGKHFYCLEGELLKEFKANHQIDEQLKFATKLYLWTEKGVFLHAKSLNTNKAWEVYDLLVDSYFRVKDKTFTYWNELNELDKLARLLELSKKEKIKAVYSILCKYNMPSFGLDQLISNTPKLNQYNEQTLSEIKDFIKVYNPVGNSLKTYYESYRGYCIKNDIYPLSKNSFCNVVKNFGYTSKAKRNCDQVYKVWC